MLIKSNQPITSFVLAKDVSVVRGGAAALVLLAIVAASFFLRFGEPVSGKHADYFRPDLMHQNIDTPGWITTGLLLPTSTTVTRAPRPLYPAGIALAHSTGLIEEDTITDPSEAIPDPVWNGAVKALITENILMAVFSLWLFFALCRYYSFSYNDALAATVFAATCFGFNFWIAQLTPEILTFFAVIVQFILLIWAGEAPSPRATIARWTMTGFVIGIFLLGKELYFLLLFSAMLLGWKRQWQYCGVYLLAAVIPAVLWRLYITQILDVFDPSAYNRKYGYFVWLKETLFHVPIQETIARLAKNFSRQIMSFAEAFLYYPLLFMVLGFFTSRPKHLLLPLTFFALSFSAMYFGSNFIKPRISFMAWPVVCAFAWLGILATATVIGKMFGFSKEKGRNYVAWAALFVHVIIQYLPVYHAIDYG